MSTLIRCGILYPVTSPAVLGGWILVRNGRILQLGAGEAPPLAEEVIDLSAHLVMPGMVNAHCHLQFGGALGKLPRAPFTDWVEAAVVFSAQAETSGLVRSVQEGMDSLLASGVTAVGDITDNPAVAAAVADGPLRPVIFAEALGPLPAAAEQVRLATLKLVQGVIASGGRAGISPHGPHSVSPQLFAALARTAREIGVPFTSHVAETPEERLFVEKGEGPFREFLRERKRLAEPFAGFGASPVGHIHRLGALDRLLAVHCNEVDENDISLLAEAHAVPVFCPASSRWFGREKVMPFDRFIDDGLAPCLGTDSLASNETLSMLDELRAAREYFPKIERERLVEAATINGARALGLECGALAQGLRADIAAFPLQCNTPLDALFMARRACWVMVDGAVRLNTA